MSRPRQNQRGRLMPPPMTAAQKREIIRKQRLARRKAIQTQRQKVESAKTPLDRRQARTILKAIKVDGRLQKAKRRGNTEKAKRLETKIERLAKKNQRIRNKQMEKRTFAKVPSRSPRSRVKKDTRQFLAMQKANTIRARGRG